MCTLLYDVLFFHALYLEDKSQKQWKADLRSADLKCANLRGVDLRDADLRGVDLKYANLRGADLRGADLRGVDLKYANLRGADLKSTNLDFASVYLSCKFINIKDDDRLFSQLVYHLTRQQWDLDDKCGEALRVIEKYADLFLKYRDDLVSYEDFKKGIHG
jgi:hypothetical protein